MALIQQIALGFERVRSMIAPQYLLSVMLKRNVMKVRSTPVMIVIQFATYFPITYARIAFSNNLHSLHFDLVSLRKSYNNSKESFVQQPPRKGIIQAGTP